MFGTSSVGIQSLKQNQQLTFEVPKERFPGRAAEVAPALVPVVEKKSVVEASPRDDRIPVKKEHSSESLRCHEPSGNVKIKVESGSPVRLETHPAQLLRENQRLGYVSRSELLASKALEKGIDMSEFRKLVDEKNDIAQARFPGESPDWQAWLAESMVWSFYCKSYLAHSRSFCLRDSDHASLSRFQIRNTQTYGEIQTDLFLYSQRISLSGSRA